MKLLIASDIHGDVSCTQALLNVYDTEKCDKLLLLGDILYHGPRNDLPTEYNPKAVIELLNQRAQSILAVRGNCDTEVDQMVLSFPILADYIYLSIDGINIFATHGHKYNLDVLPPLSKGEILLHGHTHVLKIERFGNDNYYINPGSITIPKENNPRSYIILENRVMTIYDFDGKIIDKIEF